MRTFLRELRKLTTYVNTASGSVIGPLVAKELLKKDHNVMVVLVGDTGTEKFSRNTAGTIRSYEAISQETGKPVVCSYHQNNTIPKMDTQAINMEIIKIISAMRLLFSGNNHGVDKSDLTNFINFYNVTHSKSTLTLLTTHSVKSEGNPNRLKQALDLIYNGKPYSTIAMASISPNTPPERQSIMCEYLVEGTVAIDTDGEGPVTNFYILTDNYFARVLKELDDIIADYEESNQAHVLDRIEVGNRGEGGLVF